MCRTGKRGDRRVPWMREPGGARRRQDDRAGHHREQQISEIVRERRVWNVLRVIGITIEPTSFRAVGPCRSPRGDAREGGVRVKPGESRVLAAVATYECDRRRPQPTAVQSRDGRPPRPPGAGSADERQAGSSCGGAARGRSHPREVVREVGRPTAHRTAPQQFVHDPGGERDTVGRCDGLASERVGEVEPVDDRLDDPARRELAELHQRVVPGADECRRVRARSSTAFVNVSASTPGMSAGVLPSTIV